MRKSRKYKNENWLLIGLVVAGSLIRLVYGDLYEPWNQASDQIAWEIILSNNSFRYDELIHYPHEGGTMLVSLISLLIKNLTSFNSLVVSAFALDFGVRLIQIKIIQKLFNSKAAILWGIWVMIAAPILIPWGTVNFGLHYVSSVFPFILLLLLDRSDDSKKNHLKNGLVLGLACWFSYINVVLIPVYCAAQFFLYKRKFNWVYALVSLVVVLVSHILIRINMNAGFHLNQLDITSIRGVDFSLMNTDLILNLVLVLSPLSGSIIGGVFEGYYGIALSILVIILLGLSLISLFGSNKQKPLSMVLFAVIFIFLIIYALSPFYHSSFRGSYISYRHLAYIIPLVALFVILGLQELRYSRFYYGLFLIIGILGTIQLFMQVPVDTKNTKSAGWVLANKFGHDPERLSEIVLKSTENKKLLVEGIGWGTCTVIFQNCSNSAECEDKLAQLNNLLKAYPEEFQIDLINGVNYAFSEEVTPKLNQALQVQFHELSGD